ncbi:MAG: phage terminase large subunit, partial [Proteobacteria bacterium]|nr:phage terminase large subunit [Pseudomonadota bacterium]
RVVEDVDATTEGLRPINSDSEVFELSSKQIEAYNAKSQFVLYGGAKGGGKSWFLCVWVFAKCLALPKNKIFFCRRRSVDFTNTTLETWKKVVPAKAYRINEQKKKIYIYNGSVVDYGGLDDPLLIQSLNSAEYGNIAVDQAEEIDLDSFAMIRGTLRHKITNPSYNKNDPTVPQYLFPDYQVRMSANPAQCWLKDYFMINPRAGFEYIKALPTDNPQLPQDYVKNLSEAFEHRPQLLAAYLHGSWDDLTGHDICIQASAIERATKKEISGGIIKRIIVNDPARFGDDENVIYVLVETPTMIYKEKEIMLDHKSTMDTAGRLSALRKLMGAQIIAVDVIGIGAGVVDCLHDLGEPVLSINSSSKPTSETVQKKYFNLRSQMWMEAGDEFSKGRIKLDNDYILNGQLSSPKFKYTGNGKIQVESKDEIKKRLARSPDRGDAFVMGIYALKQVNSFQEEKEMESCDRVGHGTPVDDLQNGNDDDFSGYNL